MVNFGFVFGFLLGIPVAFVDHWFGQWWLLPVLGVVVGWVTNALGMWLIFEPPERRRILGIKVHGLFLRRQDEAAEVYARIIADDVITLEHIGDFLLDGPRGDRTRQMLADAMRPAIDQRRRSGCAAPSGWPSAARRSTTIRESVAQSRRRPHDHAVPRPGLQPPAGREDPRPLRRRAPRSCRRGLRGDDARRDQGGRVDALRARGDHGLRGRVPPPVDLRSGGLMADTTTSPSGADGAGRRHAPPLRASRGALEALPGLARIAASTVAAHRCSGSASTARRVPAGWLAAARPTPSVAAELVQELRPRVAAVRPARPCGVVDGVPLSPAVASTRDRSAAADARTASASERDADLPRDAARSCCSAPATSGATDAGAPGVRADPRRARSRRGPDPVAAAARRPAAVGRRAHRRAGRHGALASWWRPGCR